MQDTISVNILPQPPFQFLIYRPTNNHMHRKRSTTQSYMEVLTLSVLQSVEELKLFCWAPLLSAWLKIMLLIFCSMGKKQTVLHPSSGSFLGCQDRHTTPVCFRNLAWAYLSELLGPYTKSFSLLHLCCSPLCAMQQTTEI